MLVPLSEPEPHRVTAPAPTKRCGSGSATLGFSYPIVFVSSDSNVFISLQAMLAGSLAVTPLAALARPAAGSVKPHVSDFNILTNDFILYRYRLFNIN
jgi:hypothetical protein